CLAEAVGDLARRPVEAEATNVQPGGLRGSEEGDGVHLRRDGSWRTGVGTVHVTASRSRSGTGATCGQVAGGRGMGSGVFSDPDYAYINRCAYFDYQRERVYAR